MWIAGDTHGNLWRSEDGTNGWAVCRSYSTYGVYSRAIRYRDGLWLAAFTDGIVRSSQDGGVSWTSADLGREIFDICYDTFSAEWFAAVDGGVICTDFGDRQTFISSVTPRQVAVSDDGIVVIGSAEAGSGLWYALPGETVFRRTNVTTGNFRCLTYANRQFIAGQYATDGGGQGGIWRSPDGVTWRRVDERSSPYYACTWADGQWVMTSTYDGRIAYSANGLTWTWCDLPDTYGESMAIWSCANGNNLMLFCKNVDSGSSGGIAVAKVGRYVRSNWFYSKEEVDAMMPGPYVPSAADPTFSNAVNAAVADYAAVSNAAMWASNEVANISIPVIDHTDIHFSNEVLAVGIDTNVLAAVSWIASSTNAVAQIGDFYAALASIGVTPAQGGMTLGGLLAAIVAALAWLKKNALTDGLTNGEPTDQKLHKFFQNSNSLLTSRIGALTKTNAESAAQPTNAVTLNDDAPMTVTVAEAVSPATPSLAVTFANARQADGLRICELYILNGTASTDLTFDAAVQFVGTGDSFPACEAGINYFVFAEIAANKWKVTRETLKTITTPVAAA